VSLKNNSTKKEEDWNPGKMGFSTREKDIQDDREKKFQNNNYAAVLKKK
jgi:hypothetical protein